MDGRLRHCCGMQQLHLFDQQQSLCRACIETNLDTRMIVIVPASTTAAEFKDKVSRSHLQNFPEHGNVDVRRLMVMVCGYWYAFSEGLLGAVCQGPDARFKAELVLENDRNRHEQQQYLHQDAVPQNFEVPCTISQKEKPVRHVVPVRDASPVSRDPIKSPSQYRKDPSYTDAERLGSASHAADVVMNVLVASSRKLNGRVDLRSNEERACEAQPGETGFTEQEIDKREDLRDETAAICKEQESVARERSELETPKRKLDMPDRTAKRSRAGTRSQNTDYTSEKRAETGWEVNSKAALDEFDKAVSEDVPVTTNRDKVVEEATSGETKSKDARSKEARSRDGLVENKEIRGCSSKETGVGDKDHESKHADDKEGSTKRANVKGIQEVSSGRTSKHADELANKPSEECERSKSRQTNSRQTEGKQAADSKQSDGGVSALGKDVDGSGNSDHAIDDGEECKKLEDMCQNLITQHFSYSSSSRSGVKDQGGGDLVRPTSPDDSEASNQSSPRRARVSISGRSSPSMQDLKATKPRDSGSESSEDNEDQNKRKAEVSGKNKLGEEVHQVSASSERTSESGEKDDRDKERTSGVKLFRVESSTSSEKTSPSKRSEKENEQEQSEREVATSMQSKEKRSMRDENEASEDEAEGNKPEVELSTSSGKTHSKQESQQKKNLEPLSEAATQERFEPELSTSSQTTTPSKQTNLPQNRDEEEEQGKLEELPSNLSKQKKVVQARSDASSSSSEKSEQIKHKKVNQKAKTANKKAKRRGRQATSSSSETYEPSKASSSSEDSDSSSTSEPSAPARKNPRRGVVDSRLKHFVERSDALEELINIKLSKRMSAPADAPANGPDVVYETQTLEDATPISVREPDKNLKTVNAKSKAGKTKSNKSPKSVQQEAPQDPEGGNAKKTAAKQKMNGTYPEQEKPADNTASVAASEDNTEVTAKGKGSRKKDNTASTTASEDNTEVTGKGKGSKKKPRQKVDKEKKTKNAQAASDTKKRSRPAVPPAVPVTPLDVLKRKYAAETPSTGTNTAKKQRQAESIACPKGCGKVYSRVTASYTRHVASCKGKVI